MKITSDEAVLLLAASGLQVIKAHSDTILDTNVRRQLDKRSILQ